MTCLSQNFFSSLSSSLSQPNCELETKIHPHLRDLIPYPQRCFRDALGLNPVWFFDDFTPVLNQQVMLEKD